MFIAALVFVLEALSQLSSTHFLVSFVLDSSVTPNVAGSEGYAWTEDL